MAALPATDSAGPRNAAQPGNPAQPDDTVPPPATDAVAKALSDLFGICEDALTLLALEKLESTPNLLRGLAELRAETLAAFAFLG
jgi:hypothetical protein